MTKHNTFPPIASQREIDREPAMPTLGDWIGGVALFVAIFGGIFLAWVTQ